MTCWLHGLEDGTFQVIVNSYSVSTSPRFYYLDGRTSWILEDLPRNYLRVAREILERENIKIEETDKKKGVWRKNNTIRKAGELLLPTP